MDPVVTARVPEGVRSRAVDVLREIGSNTSELVNAAFNYVIQERKLPKPSIKACAVTVAPTLTEEQIAQVSSFMQAVKIDVPAAWGESSFEDLLEEVSEERYADLC